jgi:hypothetical protein
MLQIATISSYSYEIAPLLHVHEVHFYVSVFKGDKAENYEKDVCYGNE